LACLEPVDCLKQRRRIMFNKAQNGSPKFHLITTSHSQKSSRILKCANRARRHFGDFEVDRVALARKNQTVELCKKLPSPVDGLEASKPTRGVAR